MRPMLSLPLAEVAAYPGLDGFLGGRGSLMMDVVVVAMVLVLLIMAASIGLVRYRQAFQLHKRIQLSLGTLLLIAIVAFEVDVQFISAWEERAAPSPYFDEENAITSPVGIGLVVHLFFAVPTAVLWTFVIVQALRKFPAPTTPSPYSGRHRRWGTLAAIEMLMTTLTGWVFYWLAFMAT